MVRRIFLTGLLGLAFVVSAATSADEKEKKPESIKEFMKTAHKGADAYVAVVGKALKAKDFEKAAPTAKAWAALAPHLGDFDPPKGDKESWKKLTKKYATAVEALNKAVEGKDAKAAGSAFKAASTSCKGCHTAHRGK
jgi:cytochrome c556